MCLAIPGKVTKIEGRKAWVKYPGNQIRYAMVGVSDLQIGDYVLVQMGIAMRKILPSEAAEAIKAWQS